MRRLVAHSKQVAKVAVLALAGLALIQGSAWAQGSAVTGQAPQSQAAVEPARAPAAETSDTESPAQPVRQVVVSIPDRRLALVEAGRTLKVYPVAVGANQTPTPTGDFKVINRIEHPTYYKPGVVIEPGDDNPLGTRWIGISLKGYGIHGTNVPASIGKAASSGCIRMRQADLEELFELLRPGDAVNIRAERDAELARVLTVEPAVTAKADTPAETGSAETRDAATESRN